MNDIKYFTTAKGSVYTYLPDGRTQRFKKAENKLYMPMDSIVFIPNYSWFKENVKTDIVPTLGENESQMEQLFLDYAQGKGKKMYITDNNMKKLGNNLEIALNDGPTLLTFGDENKTDFYIPVAKDPRIGFYTFDTRKFKRENDWIRERHLGNKIIEIVRK